MEAIAPVNVSLGYSDRMGSLRLGKCLSLTCIEYAKTQN